LFGFVFGDTTLSGEARILRGFESELLILESNLVNELNMNPTEVQEKISPPLAHPEAFHLLPTLLFYFPLPGLKVAKDFTFMLEQVLPKSSR
jgi:hypothetical protein